MEERLAGRERERERSRIVGCVDGKVASSSESQALFGDISWDFDHTLEVAGAESRLALRM